MTARSIEQLIEAIHENTQMQRELLEAMEEARTRTPWVSPEEAARILGLPLTASRSHRRRIAALVNRGLLTKVRDGRPPYYYREELIALSDRVAAGKVAI